VTGSVGKTTTKELAAALLATKYAVLKSPANFNDESASR
jgi:UDP-N-acetylmuramoyl-tripeptide--D-alanyl-D-alanine ligase